MTPEMRTLRARLAATLVVVSGMAAAVPYHSYLARQELLAPNGVLDESWILELPVRLADGELSGRDFIFTYGPLYQVVHSFGLLVPPHNLASVMRFHSLPDAFITLLGAWLVLGLTKAPLAWRAGAYLMWALFWPPINLPPYGYSVLVGLKPLAGLFMVSVCGHFLQATQSVGERRRFSGKWPMMLLWALAAPLLVLYSFDMGVMSALALILTGTVVAVVKPAWRWRAAWALVSAVSGFALFAAMLSLSSWSKYLPDSWQLSIGYSQAMVVGLSLQGFAMIVAAIIAGCLILIFAIHQLRRTGERQHRRALVLIGAASFSLVWTRYGLSRSDDGHILKAIIPMLFTAGCLLPCYLRANEMRLARLSLICLIPLVLLCPYGSPYAILFGTKYLAGVAYRVAGIRKIELRPSHLVLSNELMNHAVAAAQQLPGEALYVWPYETLTNVLADRRNPAYTVQSYVAVTPQAERETVARLQRIPALPALLFRKSPPIDDVEAMTRTPLVFRYLMENYQLSGTRADILLLERRPQALRWHARPLALAQQRFSPGGKRSLTVNFSDADGDGVRVSDLLLLRLRASKTRTFGIGKPGVTSLTFYLSNGERRVQTVILPPDGNPHDILVSASTLRADPLLISIFADRIWRASESLTALQLNWAALDWMTVTPDEISLEGVSVLAREGAANFETSPGEQATETYPESYQWMK